MDATHDSVRVASPANARFREIPDVADRRISNLLIREELVSSWFESMPGSHQIPSSILLGCNVRSNVEASGVPIECLRCNNGAEDPSSWPENIYITTRSDTKL
jgi:hypothetical protein